MKGNEFSLKELRPHAVEWLTKLHQTLVIKEYGKGTVHNYCQEMKLLFKYFNHKAVEDIRQGDIEQYLQYIKEVHIVGRAKCRSVAQSCSFFFKRILPAPYIVPSNLYPKKQFILLNIMSEEEVIQLFAAPLTLKEYCDLGLLYGSGLRHSDTCNLRLQDSESQFVWLAHECLCHHFAICFNGSIVASFLCHCSSFLRAKEYQKLQTIIGCKAGQHPGIK